MSKFNKKEKDLKNSVQKEENGFENLYEDALEQVNGAGNPFEDIPRVPTQPIDDDLRDNV